MTQPEINPVDHHRTTRQHAGEAMKNGANGPGIVGVALAVVALFVGLAAFAIGNSTAGIVAVVAAVVIGALALAWLRHTHKKVREAEVQWHEAHSEEPPPPPTS